MMTAPVITVVFKAVVLALTPLERWEAVRKFNSSFMTERWFILIGVITIIALTVLLFVVSLNQKIQERESGDQLFAEYAEKRGLSERERQILFVVASKAGLKRSESIFTMGAAFDRGMAKMMEENLTQQTTEEGKQLKTELSFLREKLGFQKKQAFLAGSPTKPKKLSSRQILVGKKLYITRRKARDSGDIESIVVKNSDIELAVELTPPVKITFGEFWCVRYYFGSSVWEFDTSVVSYDGNILVLNHSDDVRFINRRRFLRVPVQNPAFIASFPFARTLTWGGDSGKKESVVNQDLAKASVGAWGPPEFVPAVVTELAGLGLRLESTLEVKAGERILVVFSLDEEKDQDLIPARQDEKAVASRIVEDIGEVRHTKVLQNGLSIAVELTGLSDSDVDELIRATNAASLRAGDRNKNISASVNAEEYAPEPTAVQGV